MDGLGWPFKQNHGGDVGMPQAPQPQGFGVRAAVSGCQDACVPTSGVGINAVPVGETGPAPRRCQRPSGTTCGRPLQPRGTGLARRASGVTGLSEQACALSPSVARSPGGGLGVSGPVPASPKPCFQTLSLGEKGDQVKGCLPCPREGRLGFGRLNESRQEGCDRHRAAPFSTPGAR